MKSRAMPNPNSATEPNDVRLGGLLAPEGKSILVRIEDTPEHLIVRPLGYPMWICWFSMLLLLVLVAGYTVYEAVHQRFDPLTLTVIIPGCFAVPFCVGFMW